MNSYESWLQRTGQPVYEMAGTYWTLYHNALMLASPKPEPVELNKKQTEELLRKSGALFLRYFTRTVNHPTHFWYTACAQYNLNDLPHKVRTQIRRGYKGCRVERVTPAWLAENGHECYLAAFSRYRNSSPEPRARFDRMCNVGPDDPFEFWGVFAEKRLVGFTKCAVGDDYAATLVVKLDPDYMQLSSSSALQDTILNAYVSEQRKHLFAGYRSITHDTNAHDFLLKLGYRRVYCDLKVAYRPAVRACVNLLYRIRSLVGRIPESNMKRNIQGILTQEGIRRAIESDVAQAIPTSHLERITPPVCDERYGATEK